MSDSPKKLSALEDFLSRLPKGAEIAVAGEHFLFEGQILNRDETYILISDGQGIQLARIGAIDSWNFIPEISEEFMVVQQ